MPKPLALSIAACLILTGCQVFEKSQTWETVVSVRPGDSFRDADPSAAYAEKLHAVLLDQGVEHYVVTYQFHYYSHQYDEAVGTRTAVVYRDNADERYPWWVKDERTASPFWLPNGEMDRQLSFYCRRKVEVIEKKAYPAHGGGGKASVTLVHPAPAPHHVVTVEKPQPVTHIAQVKPRPVPEAKPVATTKPAAATQTATEKSAVSRAISTAVTKILHPTAVAASKQKVASEPAPVAVSRPDPSWAPPTTIDPVEQASDPAPRDTHLEKLFRTRNGTSYDPTSAVDRRKMEQLKHGLVGKETSGEQGFRRGVDGQPAF